ncbi:MAG: hypothetical protein A3A08_01665 [Candidatus Nealsonbacteria bacterium RIFCSPLOWO2_01_FULL_41_9]|uniref:DUF4306 domain-containing protein n=1 Tax=Candidatus Nealsonbacteria bacterium RIFCSPLOWO2_01_FULL_41_9 TaxID=1801671 RepID=A0A1G2EDG4_9BACT|nr:MAG: hypothetical protein A3A08_01665 [Candidatus Nealsonbacteria bacterium RIFCSPLOWO2_01_FULL_41_9]
MTKALIGIGLFLSLIATILLYFGSQETPWSIQTWDGNGSKEIAFRYFREINANYSFLLMSIGFLLQLIGLFWPTKNDKKF